MINRNYLPYKSAREYVDRGMAKWMGFFISDHKSALSKHGDGNNVRIKNKINPEDTFLLLGQCYINKLNISISTTKQNYIGKVYELMSDYLYFSSENKIIKIKFKDILNISFMEV